MSARGKFAHSNKSRPILDTKTVCQVPSHKLIPDKKHDGPRVIRDEYVKDKIIAWAAKALGKPSFCPHQECCTCCSIVLKIESDGTTLKVNVDDDVCRFGYHIPDATIARLKICKQVCRFFAEDCSRLAKGQCCRIHNPKPIGIASVTPLKDEDDEAIQSSLFDQINDVCIPLVDDKGKTSTDIVDAIKGLLMKARMIAKIPELKKLATEIPDSLDFLIALSEMDFIKNSS